MLKKSITYTDFNGDEQTEDFYFNLSKAEITKMELSRKGGLKEHLEAIVAAQDGKEIIAEMENIVRLAYGKKSDDGRRFIKNQQLWEEFQSSEAYSVFFMELVTETNAAIAFVNGIVPKDLSEQVNADQIPLPDNVKELAGDGTPQKLTPSEIAEMDSDELKSGLATGKYIL